MLFEPSLLGFRMADQSASIRLSTEHKGRKRRAPVWIGRYRIVGKDSAKALGKAWTKRSRAPEGYLTRSQAESAVGPLTPSSWLPGYAGLSRPRNGRNARGGSWLCAWVSLSRTDT